MVKKDILAALEEFPGTLNLFPTENRMSPRAIQALSTDSVHRYPLSIGRDSFYGNTLMLEQIYKECEQLCCRFFDARYAFINPLSGLHAMQTVLMTLTNIGDNVLIMDPTCGGHYATEKICSRLGLVPKTLPFNRRTCLIDTTKLYEMTRSWSPKLVYLDISTLLRLPRIKEIREAIGPEPLLCFDASQVLGLILAGSEGTGLEVGATICSGSTHKTLPGPQKGILLTNDDGVRQKIQSYLPYAVSSAHANSVGALAITLDELMQHRIQYGRDIITNAQALAQALDKYGFDVSGRDFNYSETHQVWISPPDNMSPIKWGRQLLAANIRVTVVTLPSTGKLGIRLGVQETTRLGMKDEEMQKVARLMMRCLLANDEVKSIREDVAALARTFSNVRYTS